MPIHDNDARFKSVQFSLGAFLRRESPREFARLLTAGYAISHAFVTDFFVSDWLIMPEEARLPILVPAI